MSQLARPVPGPAVLFLRWRTFTMLLLGGTPAGCRSQTPDRSRKRRLAVARPVSCESAIASRYRLHRQPLLPNIEAPFQARREFEDGASAVPDFDRKRGRSR